MAQLIDSFLFDLDKFFTGGNSWQAGLYQQIEGLTVDQAIWKPSADRHSIWDVLIHVNFWKQYAIAAVRGNDKPDPDAGNWTLVPADASETNWKKEVERTKGLQEELKAVAKEMGDSLYDTEKKLSNYIRQLICHDSYHAGQIGLLRVMQGLKPIE